MGEAFGVGEAVGVGEGVGEDVDVDMPPPPPPPIWVSVATTTDGTWTSSCVKVIAVSDTRTPSTFDFDGIRYHLRNLPPKWQPPR